jgi:hypothetical protein
MPNLLMFKWWIDRDGYNITELDPRGVIWTPDATYHDIPPKGASPSIVRIQKRWNTIVSPAPGHEDKPYLVLEPTGDDFFPIEPLEINPGLFVDFAGTAQTPEGVKSFADKYGQIQGVHGPVSFEPWYREIKIMKNAVRGWEKGKREGSLRKWVNNFNTIYPELFDDKGRASASVCLQNTDDPLLPTFRMVPHDLLSAMWLQFAQQVSSSTGLRLCKLCSTWFVFGTGTGRRKSAHYCSPRCYKAAWKHENERKQSK